jgi:hypothetical protein
MTISKKKQFQQVRRSSTRAAIVNPKLVVDIGPFIPQYSSVESLYGHNKLHLGQQYTRGLPDSKCIDRFENAKHLTEVKKKICLY